MVVPVPAWVNVPVPLMALATTALLGVCPSIAFLKRGSNNRVACGTRAPDLARLSDE